MGWESKIKKKGNEMFAIGQKVKITDFGDGRYNGMEGEIVERSESEKLQWPYKAAFWKEREDLVIKDGKIYQKINLVLREGEFEPIE